MLRKQHSQANFLDFVLRQLGTGYKKRCHVGLLKLKMNRGDSKKVTDKKCFLSCASFLKAGNRYKTATIFIRGVR